MTKPLTKSRRDQLALLHAARAFTRAEAVHVSFNSDYRAGTLSAMIGEGLVEQAQLPFNGDSKRRLSHYWLTFAGRSVGAVERAIDSCRGEGWIVRRDAFSQFNVSQRGQRHIFTPNELLAFAGITL